MYRFVIHLILVVFLFYSVKSFSEEVIISVGSDFVRSPEKSLFQIKVLEEGDDVSVVEMDSSQIEALSGHMHESYLRCGGFMVHESKEEALETISRLNKNFDYWDWYEQIGINQGDRIVPMIGMTQEAHIRSVISRLSEFHNRFYKAESGVNSQAWLKTYWEQLAQGRTDIRVDYYQHAQWAQPSVVMTVEGYERPQEVIVIGGHADSIAGWWGQVNNRAPGADDNASGIATITEIIRVMINSGYRPRRTVQFMGYAAEEVGLRGSHEIAKSYQGRGINVQGVLQLDMTNFHGSQQDIVLMSDFTSQTQNQFIGALIDKYLQVPWGYDQCGYACSDHASWTGAGYPASIPFEARMREMNRKIHTDNDTISMSGGNASHALKFAKLGIAYLVEMAK